MKKLLGPVHIGHTEGFGPGCSDEVQCASVVGKALLRAIGDYLRRGDVSLEQRAPTRPVRIRLPRPYELFKFLSRGL